MRAMRTAALLGAALLLAGLCGPAAAQLSLAGMNVEGDVAAGYRYLERPSPSRRGKFEEYRDLPEAPFLEQLHLRLFRPDESYSFEFEGSKWGQQDQEFSLRTGRLGLWQFGFDWDQTPHIFSTTARMLATESARGIFTLPTSRPLLTAYNTARELDEISTRWDTARFSLVLTPTPDLDLTVNYARIAKDGDRPFSIALGSPGNNFLEILEPIEQTVHDVRLRATLAREQWQIQVGYALSIFQNAEKSITADNPCFGLTAAVTAGGCGADATGAPATGLISLPPDNMAHTFNVAGGVNLPMRTRVNANVAYSLRLQDESFLPHTINPAISSALLALPQESLDGMVGVFLFNLNATSRPIRPLTLSLKYRVFDYDNMSDEPLFPAHVLNDRTLVVEPRQAGGVDYTRHNAEVDARWRVIQPLAATVGGGWEGWSRNLHREVPESDEYFAKAALDVTPVDWLLTRLTYRPSFRRISRYNTFAHLSHTVVEDLVASDLAQSQSTLLRKFDEGERDRQQVDVLFQVVPADFFTTTVTGQWRYDDYIDSSLGLQEATNWSTGIDFNWTPLERLAISGGYVYESIEQIQRSRSRPVSGTTTFDFPDFDWLSDSLDTIHTFHAGVTTTLIRRTLDWTLGANYSTALGRIATRNPAPLTSGTAAQRLTAQAKPFPAFEDALLRFDTALRYHFWKVWTASLGYAFESFQKNDWRTDGLNPFVPGVTSIWLGNDARDYDAHIVALTLGYRFR